MPDKPVIAQRTPCIVEVGPGTVYWCQCVDRKPSRFVMGSMRGRSFRRWRLTSKRRNGWHSVVVSKRRSLPSVMGLTRGSNNAVLAATPHSECERLGGSVGGRCVSMIHSNWRRAIKGCALLGVDERASGDATAC